jgi:phosphohistidine phosphatase
MLRLMLLRHAKSGRSEPGQRDHDRPLAPRGRENASQIGAYMSRHGLIPDLVLTSPAKRSCETSDLIAAAFKTPPPVVQEPKLYQAEPEKIIETARASPREVRTLLIVGHNPGLHIAANLLVASGNIDARERLREKLSTTGLVIIDFAFDDWRKLHLNAGRLDRFVVPRMLTAATD